MAKSPKLALIDAHALIHRAFHALPPMSTKAGVPTNAVYGFTAMLLKVLRSIKPTHVVAAFDMAGPTFRHVAFADYKAHRPKADPTLIQQFDLVRRLVRAFNIPVIEKKGFEADDIIGTLTRKLNHTVNKVIVTGDLDTLQLVDETTSVVTLKRGATDTIVYDTAAVVTRFGFPPARVPDYKGLCGDASDNIPGLPGVGEKTARELVGQYGTIEDIYKHLDELSPRVQARLRGQKTAALFSRKLAVISRDVPVDFDLATARLDDYNVDDVHTLFAKLEFKSFLTQLPASARASKQLSLTAARPTPATGPQFPLPDHYHLVSTSAAEAKLRQQLLKEPLIAFDTENERLGARTFPIVGMSFAVRQGNAISAWYVPTDPTRVKAWRELLESKRVTKVGHNLKYDLTLLRQSGVKLAGIAFDSMIASYLLQPAARQHGLDALALQELDHQTIPLSALIGTGPEQRSVAEVPLEDLATYACEDAEIALRLYETFAPKIKAEGLETVFTTLELPLIPVLADMEWTGVKLDAKQLRAMGVKVQRRLHTLQKKIWQQAGEEFNVNSTQQLRRILFTKLLLPTDAISRTQSGYSTAAAELEKLRHAHPIIALLEEYRELSKLLNTYISTLPTLIDTATARLHTSFNQTIAATGRLSSVDPNLQNIPVRTETGQAIRAAFITERGHRLVKADYSQLELRIAAHLAHDEKMIDAFRQGQDIHRATAAWVYGIPADEVTDAQRREAKALNFGVLYGMGPRKFAQTSGLSPEQARSFIDRYKEQYTGITKLIATTLAQTEETGFVETMFGRRRYMPELKSTSPPMRAQAERITFNFPIQGSAADILKKAMIALHTALATKFPGTHLILTVHDELVCEAPTKDAPKVAATMKQVMESVTRLDVPLEVEVAIGPNWRDMVVVK